MSQRITLYLFLFTVVKSAFLKLIGQAPHIMVARKGKQDMGVVIFILVEQITGLAGWYLFVQPTFVNHSPLLRQRFNGCAIFSLLIAMSIYIFFNIKWLQDFCNVFFQAFDVEYLAKCLFVIQLCFICY